MSFSENNFLATEIKLHSVSVKNISDFDASKQYWQGTLFLEKYIFEHKGKLLAYYKNT